jgi:hypothetical protein
MAGAKIAAARTGANALVDAMLPGGSSSYALVGLVPLQGCYDANPALLPPVGLPNSHGCVDSDEYPSSSGDIVSLASDANRLHNGINQLSAPGGSGTNVCEGLKMTRLELFESGVARTNAARYIVLLTDAENNWNTGVNSKTAWVHSGGVGDGCAYTGSSTNANVHNRDLGVRTDALATNIKTGVSGDGQKAGQTVTIFVIMYGPNATGSIPANCDTSLLSSTTADPTSQTYTKNLARCIASEAGDLFLAPNASDISDAFEQIISRLPVRLVR